MEERILHENMEETVPVGDIRFFSRRLCRTVRVGGVPVLTVTAVWPEAEAICLRDTKEASRSEHVPLPEDVTRFNQGCRRVAETFLDWGLGRPSDEARAAYEAAGPGAAYRFPRRELSCRLTVHSVPFDDMPEALSGVSKAQDGATVFCLEREVRVGLRRREGGTAECAFSLWAYPALSPMRMPGRRFRAKMGRKNAIPSL